MGWDGKPIPYWLYNLHGLGQESVRYVGIRVTGGVELLSGILRNGAITMECVALVYQTPRSLMRSHQLSNCSCTTSQSLASTESILGFLAASHHNLSPRRCLPPPPSISPGGQSRQPPPPPNGVLDNIGPGGETGAGTSDMVGGRLGVEEIEAGFGDGEGLGDAEEGDAEDLEGGVGLGEDLEALGDEEAFDLR
ncbi:hypothetical protein ACLB2K_037842 [Fragaria x ananassa]